MGYRRSTHMFAALVCLLGFFSPPAVAFHSSSPLCPSCLFQHEQSNRPWHNSQSHQRPSRSGYRKSAFRLNSALTTALGAADTFWRNSPYLAAALTCGVKASAADYVAQRRQRQKENTEGTSVDVAGEVAIQEPARLDLQRNLAYLVYGSIYQGVAQEYIYNHLYPMFFGSGTDVVTVLSKVLFDLLVQTTLVTLPIAYFSKALIYRYSFKEAIRRYKDDIQNHNLLTKYFALWGPFQCLTFSIVPEHFRVTFIACISFFWLIILSSIASRTRVGEIIQNDEKCLLEDGQTCRIDG